MFRQFSAVLVSSRVMRVNQHEVPQRDILEQFVVVVHPSGLTLQASRRGQLLSSFRTDDYNPIRKDAARVVAERGPRNVNGTWWMLLELGLAIRAHPSSSMVSVGSSMSVV